MEVVQTAFTTSAYQRLDDGTWRLFENVRDRGRHTRSTTTQYRSNT
jgi:hypothetical protein